MSLCSICPRKCAADRAKAPGYCGAREKAHIARAALEGIAFQVTDMMRAMRKDAGCEISVLHVDGGASVSNIMMQIQSDLLRIPVE